MANYPDHLAQDERRHGSNQDVPFHRRLRDTFFNKTRWPAFIVLWFIGGIALLAHFVRAFV